MRHNRSINHLGRQSGHRKAMLSNMSCSLIEHKRIQTTVAKAKALKMYLEPVVTKSKEDTTASRRCVFSYLKSKEAVTELFGVIAPKIADRPGGYLRVLHTGFRQGDGSEMALVEFVDFNENALSSAQPKGKAAVKSTRRSGKKAAVKEEAPVAEAPATEAPAEEKAPAKKAPAKKSPAKKAAAKEEKTEK